MKNGNDLFNEWLEENAESGIHLKGLTPKEYGQAIWASMHEENEKLKKRHKDDMEDILDIGVSVNGIKAFVRDSLPDSTGNSLGEKE